MRDDHKRAWLAPQPGAGFVYKKHAVGLARVKALEHEAAVLARLNLPFMPRLVDFELTTKSSAVLIMQRVSGVPLSAVPRNERRQRHIAAQIWANLVCLHAAGWIHGDLHPGNILVSTSDTAAQTSDVQQQLTSIWFVDWESARPIGYPYERSECRHFTLGYSHPNLIFGKQSACPQYDHYAAEALF